MAPKRDDEALGRAVRVFGPKIIVWLKTYAPVAGIFYALGGGSGTLVARVNDPGVTMDSLRAVIAPVRDSVRANADVIANHERRMDRDESVLASHSAYLAAFYSPWTPAYRGP